MATRNQRQLYGKLLLGFSVSNLNNKITMDEARHLGNSVKNAILRLQASEFNRRKITNDFKDYGINDDRYLEIQKEGIRRIAIDLLKDFKQSL